MPATPHDVAIVTNRQGYKEFKEAFQQFFVEEKYIEEKSTYQVLFSINGCPVELTIYQNEELNMFDNTRIISWHGLHLPILPLKHVKVFYEAIGNHEKANMIDRFIQDNVF